MAGHLLCDDYRGYKELFLGSTIAEVGCMAYARRKFVELHLTNNSALAATAIEFIGQLYGNNAAARRWGSSRPAGA